MKKVCMKSLTIRKIILFLGLAISSQGCITQYQPIDFGEEMSSKNNSETGYLALTSAIDSPEFKWIKKGAKVQLFLMNEKKEEIDLFYESNDKVIANHVFQIPEGRYIFSRMIITFNGPANYEFGQPRMEINLSRLGEIIVIEKDNVTNIGIIESHFCFERWRGRDLSITGRFRFYTSYIDKTFSEMIKEKTGVSVPVNLSGEYIGDAKNVCGDKKFLEFSGMRKPVIR